MNSIVSIDAQEQIAIVQPGVLNSAVSDAAAPHGLFYTPDPASTTYGGQVPRSGVAGVLLRGVGVG